MGDSIEKIIVEGNKKVSKDTILFYIKSAENGLYSTSMLREDFKALWNTGFFENISIEAENGTSGKIVKIIVKENLLIKSVTYKTGKKIKESDIVEKLQANNITLLAFSYYNPAKIKRVEKIIKDMLLEKGYNQGKANIITKEDKDQVEITVQVSQGPKTRIANVVFPGLKGTGVSPKFLRWGMKNNKVHNILSIFSSKDVYNKEKMTEDLEGIKLRLQQKGFLEAKVGTPSFSMYPKYTAFGQLQPMMEISIPVEVGPKYKIGDLKVEGNKILKTTFLINTLKMKKGKTYNMKKRNKQIEEILKIYRSLGYIYCNVAPLDDLDPVNKVADLTLRFTEGEVAYLGKLEFKGNTFTKDHVIRREWFLCEGERLNMSALEDCITRMKQLGLVTIEKMPEFKPDPKNPQKVDILAEVRELNRQQINFNVGYSGYDGWFLTLGYSTQNFMGMGETFSVNFQNGTRTKNYSLSFSEPYVFNLPASLGLTVHKSKLEYPYLYTRKSDGFGLSTSFRFWRYYGISLGYDFENIEISDVYEGLDLEDSYYYSYYYSEGKRKISSLSPTLYYSTVDSPIFPTSGTKYLLTYGYSGGFLGGDIDMHKLKVQFVKFIPIWKRKHTIGIQAVYQGLKGFGKNEIPIYEKYFLGGEQSIRGYDIYRIGPRNASGGVIGGTKAFFLNFEYQVPITPQFSLVAYYDMGNSYAKGVPISLNNFYSSTGLELKVFIPMLNVPFRLIFAYNSRLLFSTDSHFAFRFAVGPSFN
ncbi:MAG: outer membrane protein insertion porin family [Acidobacteriota bacterium]|nr:outer membrane protein insertion porin family [Acidobacteriota bacterium]